MPHITVAPTCRTPKRARALGVIAALSVVAVAGGAAPAPASAATCTRVIFLVPSLSCSQTDRVGNQKTIATSATLSRNGFLALSSHAINRHLSEGLRGRVLVVVRDARGNHVWVSQEFQHRTLCSRLDLFCSSNRRTTFTEAMPAAVGRHAATMEIYHADGASFRDLRESVINGLRTSTAIALEVKDAVCRVYGCG